MIGAIIQARMGSTRLPGKVMLKAAGKPLLGLLVERLSYSTLPDEIIVATSVDPQDDVIADYCASQGIALFRGSQSDVLDRYYQAARYYQCDIIVRVTSDCPLTDPVLVDEMIRVFIERQHEYDLVTNKHPLTYPDGFDVMAIKALADAWEHATTPYQREHVVPYFWEMGMRVHNVEHPDRIFYQHRWMLDYPEDYELIRRIFEALYCEGRVFSIHDILNYLTLHPDLAKLNAKYIPAQT